MTLSKQLIQLKQAVVNAAPEMYGLEQQPAFQTMCKIMRLVFQHPHRYTEEVAIVRHCLLQKEIADALTPTVILWLFNTHQGQSIMLTDTLRVHQILELGFPEGGEELIAALWHYSSEFDESRQEIMIREYNENTKRIMDAIEAATALFHQNLSRNDDIDDWNDAGDWLDPEAWSPPISVSPTNIASATPLRAGILMGKLAAEYGMSITDLLKANNVSREALYHHNGLWDMNEPIENLYIEDLTALHAEQHGLDDPKPPPIASNEVLPELQSHHYSPVFSGSTPPRRRVIPGLSGKIVDVLADGNCFFHAFALGLAQKNIAFLSHVELRSRAVAYLRANPVIMHQYPNGNENSDSYLNRMSLTEIPAEGPIIEVMAVIMNVQLDMTNIDTNLEGENTSARFVINAGADRAGTVTLIRRQEERPGEPHPYQHYQVLDHPCTTRPNRSSSVTVLAPTAPPHGPSHSHRGRFLMRPDTESSHSKHGPSPSS